jgi:dipeptidyl aminopeptidase/acylaminoacyl peptidase
MRTTRRASAWLATVGLLVATACTSSPEQTPSAQQGSEPTTTSAEPSGTASPTTDPTPDPTAGPTAAPVSVDPVSLPALMAKHYDGRDLRLGRVLARNDSYTRWFITYRSGALRISGILNVPRGKGPFPVLVLGHGYIDPAVYVNGQGLLREQDYLARRGYAVLHTDYRGYAASDDDPRAELNLRLGYTEDVINAVLAVRRSTLPTLDGDRVGLLGRSMGGGVVLNVLTVQPGLVDAAVVFAPVSSDTVDNFDRFIRDGPGRDGLARAIIARHGSPEQDPEFWRNVSPRTFFDRITEPLLIHHGTSDESCPIRWSRATLRALLAAGKDARMFTYQGEHHAFIPQWPTSMRRTVAFFDRRLKN